jgi:hypothetical protein
MKKLYEVITNQGLLTPFVVVQLRAQKRTIKVNGCYHYVNFPNMLFVIFYYGWLFKKFRYDGVFAFQTTAPWSKLNEDSIIKSMPLPNSDIVSGRVCLGDNSYKKHKSLDSLITYIISSYFSSEFVGYSKEEGYPDYYGGRILAWFRPKDILDFPRFYFKHLRRH